MPVIHCKFLQAKGIACSPNSYYIYTSILKLCQTHCEIAPVTFKILHNLYDDANI
jgi:hypothetical protein